MTRILTPKHCLRQMTDSLAKMQAAQDRYADADRRYTASQASLDELRQAQGDTGYYAMQAQTWAACASALLAALDRYAPPRPARRRAAELDDAGLREAHVGLDSLPLTHGAVGGGWAINGRRR